MFSDPYPQAYPRPGITKSSRYKPSRRLIFALALTPLAALAGRSRPRSDTAPAGGPGHAPLRALGPSTARPVIRREPIGPGVANRDMRPAACVIAAVPPRGLAVASATAPKMGSNVSRKPTARAGRQWASSIDVSASPDPLHEPGTRLSGVRRKFSVRAESLCKQASGRALVKDRGTHRCRRPQKIGFLSVLASKFDFL